MLRQIMERVIMDAQDLWTTWLLNLCGASGLGLLNNRSTVYAGQDTEQDNRDTQDRTLQEAAVANILLLMWEHISLLCMPRTYKTCPLCLANGATKTLNEVHFVLQCSSVSYERQVRGMLDFTKTYPSSRKLPLVLKDYLGGDDAVNNVLYRRASTLNILLNSWLGKLDHF